MKLTLKKTERLEMVEKKLSSHQLPSEISDIKETILQILELKQKKNVVILGHNYMSTQVYYGLSDFVGDSLGLAKESTQTNADIILFNGVHFMAETAKILNPEKKVLIADTEAGCSLSEGIKVSDVKKLKENYPGVPVVSYINCSASVKAESDIICTSANAIRVVNSLKNDEVIMLPDQYLAKNVQKATDKKIIFWNGKCMVHELFTAEDIVMARKIHPGVKVISHPECKTEVTEISDFSGSTSQMSNFIEESSADKILLLTECSMGDNLKVEFPNVEFVSTCQNCPHMKKITLDKILVSLQEEKYEINVPEDIRVKAKKALDNMLKVG